MPLILSYSWLASQGIVVHPAEDALLMESNKGLAWIRGRGHEHNSAPPLPKGVHICAEHPTGEVQGAGSLHIRLALGTHTGSQHILTALIDTGAEYNLCRKGLLPDAAWRKADKPLHFYAADNTTLAGGDRQVTAALTLHGQQLHGQGTHVFTFGADLYEAYIQKDIILSYTWMAQHAIMVHPSHQAITVGDTEPLLWVLGLGHPTGGVLTSHATMAEVCALVEKPHISWAEPLVTMVVEIPQDTPQGLEGHDSRIPGHHPGVQSGSTELSGDDEYLRGLEQHILLQEDMGLNVKHLAHMGLQSIPDMDMDPWEDGTIGELATRWRPTAHSWAYGVVTSTQPQKNPSTTAPGTTP